jgi:prephenate dehydrogenase
MPIETVTIVGVGLIGGSFAKALRANGYKGKIIGVSSPSTLQQALADGVIDRGEEFDAGIAAADLVYLSHPVSRILEQIPRVAAVCRRGVLVTDAGSTKSAIVRRASESFRAPSIFLGGHPMAGKAERGVAVAEAGLFQGAVYAITPRESRLPESPLVDAFVAWIRRIGGTPMVLSPEQHDEIVTWTSHLPQLAVTALAATIGDSLSSDENARLAGPGLRDTTRLAESSFEIWKDILATNGENIDRALEQFIRRLESIRRDLHSPRLGRQFEAAAALRKNL